MQEKRIVYDDAITRMFIAASVIFALVGMLVGVFIAAQMAFPALNFDVPWLSFGRLRPLHTNAVIFAFVGNMLFAGIYYSTQRLLRVRMASDLLSRVHFWGWQLIIVAAALTLPLGLTQGKEYAELIWPIDLAVAGIWVTFGVNFFWTLAIRNEQQLYVAIWFYIATIITVAMLYVVNNLALPFSGTNSYPLFVGVQDALVQWWYGHNAVAFFLTTPILGIMYYFLPKAAERPVYSYRLSVVHFWALVFIYIWAGPHHLLNTSLPGWAQTLGMVFSLMLWAPSWGGMLNGLLTLRGAWDKLRTDPVIKFLIAGVTFYGMSTFEGPLLSIKSVNALSHYTDWTIGHVHSGALGWNGFMAAGMFYWLVPRLYGTKLKSEAAANMHFWLGTIGILIYVIAMWISGVTQGLMWKAVAPEGGLLYPDFVETLRTIQPMYIARLVGGTLFLLGFVQMTWNLIATAAQGKAVDGEVVVVVADDAAPAPTLSWRDLVTNKGVMVLWAILALSMAYLAAGPILALVVLALLVGVSVAAWVMSDGLSGANPQSFIKKLEANGLIFSVLVLLGVIFGGAIEIIPAVAMKTEANGFDPDAPVTAPYTPLEVAGRHIYVREGCYNCHSQMIRPFYDEKLRYGDPSTLGDSRWDRPFQWGSKRTGPDLARSGGKYPHLWHFEHMRDPRITSPGSNMPAYPWLVEDDMDIDEAVAGVAAQATLGVPYIEDEVTNAAAHLQKQAEAVTKDLASSGVEIAWNKEIVAVIAYLQRLGKLESDFRQPPPKELAEAR